MKLLKVSFKVLRQSHSALGRSLVNSQRSSVVHLMLRAVDWYDWISSFFEPGQSLLLYCGIFFKAEQTL